jgi:hypothetical protein
MSDRRSFVRVFFVLAFFGALSLLSMLTRPSVELIRAVDIVQLIGTGMCFGGAIVALVVSRRGVDRVPPPGTTV